MEKNYLKNKQELKNILDIFTDDLINKELNQYIKYTTKILTIKDENEPEIWKTINHPKIINDYYDISSWGRIIVKETQDVISIHLCDNGYPRVGLVKRRGVDNKASHITIRVHRLVAQTYLKPVEGKTHINHIDLDKCNANKNNLEWCDDKDNVRHAINSGAWKNKGGHTYFKPEDITEILLDYSNGMNVKNICVKYERSRSVIRNILDRKSYNKIFWIKDGYDINLIPDNLL